MSPPEVDADSMRQFHALLTEFHDNMDVRDRKYHLRTYRSVFVGSEAVDWLVSSSWAATREEAVSMGQILMETGLFSHVKGDHGFKDERLFYTFGENVRRTEVHDPATGETLVGTPAPNEESLFGSFETISLEDAQEGGSDVPHLPLVTIEGITLQRTLSVVEGLFHEPTEPELEDLGLAPDDEPNRALVENAHPLDWEVPEADDERYNFVVIGGGTAGLVTAVGSAGFEARVAIIEEGLLGGDCLNVGCVPSKALLSAAHVAHTVRTAGEYGVNLDQDSVDVDFARVMERMRTIRAEISEDDSAHRLKSLGVDVFFGRGKFIDAKSVQVNGRVLKFKRACIATGGRPGIPKIPGLKESNPLTNHSIFNLTELPLRLGVIGTGPIGCELAQAFARFGTAVVLLGRSEGILRNEDPEAAAILQAQLVADGVDVRTGVTYDRVELSSSSGTRRIFFTQNGNEEQVVVDQILVAAGRTPNVEGLNLEAAGIEYSTKYGIAVNDKLQTSNSAVYACGDVASSLQFTHMADAMARIVIRNALFFGRSKVTDLIVPWCTYTHPEIAHVGLYERDLVRTETEYTVWKRDLAHNDRAQTDSHTEGYVKCFTDGSGKILGATIVSDKAGEMISEFTMAIKHKISLGELGNVIHPYPTQAFEIKRLGDDCNRARLTPKVFYLLKRVVKFQR